MLYVPGFKLVKLRVAWPLFISEVYSLFWNVKFIIPVALLFTVAIIVIVLFWDSVVIFRFVSSLSSIIKFFEFTQEISVVT